MPVLPHGHSLTVHIHVGSIVNDVMLHHVNPPPPPPPSLSPPLPPKDFCSSDANSLSSSPKLVSETDHFSQLKEALTLLKLLYSFATEGVKGCGM